MGICSSRDFSDFQRIEQHASKNEEAQEGCQMKAKAMCMSGKNVIIIGKLIKALP